MNSVAPSQAQPEPADELPVASRANIPPAGPEASGATTTVPVPVIPRANDSAVSMAILSVPSVILEATCDY